MTPGMLARTLAALLVATAALVAPPPIGSARAAARAVGEPPADALLCRERIARIERAEGLPAGLLQAIALAESGRFDPGRRLVAPWPWTVNAGGEAAYLGSKEEAVRHVERLRAQGRTNIDVGCLQINLGWHPAAFADLEAAFDPETNAAYAAAFLQTLREEAGSWELAVERYHSRDPDRGQSYRERVWRHWASLGRGPPSDIGPAPRSSAGTAVSAARPPALAAPPPSAPLAMTPVRDAAIERAALQAVNRLAARQTWRWLQLQAPLPAETVASPPAAVLAALDPASAEPAAGAMVPSALLRRPLVFAGPGRPAWLAAPGRIAGTAVPVRIPGLLAVRPRAAAPPSARPAASPAAAAHPPAAAPVAAPPATGARRLASAS